MPMIGAFEMDQVFQILFAAGNGADTQMLVIGIDFQPVQFHRMFLQGSGSTGDNGVANAGNGGKQKLNDPKK